MTYLEGILSTVRSFITGSVINFIFSALCALAFVLIGFKLSSVIVNIIKKSKGFQKLDDSVESFLASLINITIKILVVVVAATIVGFDVTALSAVIATFGVTAGLALQGSLSNLTGGIMILIFRPFKVGDYIDNHTDSGTVKEIGIFYTTLITGDNKTITVPNGNLSNATVVNYSTQSTRRVDIEFSVAYTSDIDKVNKVMLTVANANEQILKDPAPFVALLRQDASALVFVVRAWCNSSDYWSVYFALEENMKKAFDAMGIEIPFNQLDVHFDKENQQ
ncbi:MAG: mechanosensitive ion channel [Clostridia bacterium]|nr:mechanosensitive ion channel [Clostridia bacterium]